MTQSNASKANILLAGQAQPAARSSLAGVYIASGPVQSRSVDSSLISALIARGPPEARNALASQTQVLTAGSSGETNVQADVTQTSLLVAYATGTPQTVRSDAWTYVMDGHRFYVLPLGEEGDWQYDTSTHQWSQLQTQGFNGLNFAHGVMWDLRVIGSDTLYPYILEMDPGQPFDDGFRPVEHIVTGGLSTRGRHAIGVANFTLIASVGDDASIGMPISLAFSDDNGVTYSPEFPIPLTDVGSQMLIWNALGSFAAPGRIFRITDYGGPIRLDGADCVLTIGDGADSGINDPGAP
jgi:hypothetical protein